MCLIIHRSDPTKHVPEGVITANRRSNPDGFGLAYRDPDGMTYFAKYGPDQSDEFVEKLKEIDAMPVEYVAHFRKGTSGANCKELAHPFEYEDEQAGVVLVFHNGIIPISSSGPLESDTSVFVESILAGMPSRWWEESATKYLVEQSVAGSRLLLMTSDEVVILNKSKWTERDGINYSTYPYGYYGTSYGNWSYDDDYGVYNSGGTGKWSKGGSAPKAPEPNDDVPVVIEGDFFDPYDGKWEHGEHWVDPAIGFDSADSGDCWCNTCGTRGKFYTVNAQTYIDIRHAYPMEDSEDEELIAVNGIAKLYTAVPDDVRI